MKVGNRRNIVKVGITGAAGIIGKVITEGLSDSFDLTLFYHHTEIKNQNLKKVKIDLSRAEEIKGAFEGLDAVIHLAGASHPRFSWESFLNKNIVATYNVFEEARRAGVVKVVYASSNHVQYGGIMLSPTNPLYLLSPFYKKHRGYVRINDPATPDSYYAVSKLFGENLGWYYSKMHNIQCVVLRIGDISEQDDRSSEKGTDREDFVRAMFLSRRDCIEAFRRSLQIDTEYLIAYAISDNDRRVFDMKETMEKLGTNPQDNSEDYFTEA